MANTSEPWPCPVCAGLMPVGWRDCPHCGVRAAWIDRILALDWTIRQFHYGSLTGDVTQPQYRLLVADCRARREEMTRAAQAGAEVPADTALPPRTECWACHNPCRPDTPGCGQCRMPLDTPEVRLLRYQTFLCREIREHEKAGRITPAQASRLLSRTMESLADLRCRLVARRSGR